MSDQRRLTGAWTPRRQAMAYQNVLESITRARKTVADFAGPDLRARDKALRAAADALLDHSGELVETNQADLADAREAGMESGGLDRLRLTDHRVTGLADHLRRTAELPSPVTEELSGKSQLTRIPLGVVGVIYEPQPAVTVLASGSLLKAGNAVLLRGAPAAARTDAAMVALLRAGLTAEGVSAECIQVLPTTERATIRYLVSAQRLVDLVVVRAGLSLTRQARTEASVPLVELGHGICHIYIDATADPDLVHQVVLDSTLPHRARTGAAHTVLVHQDAAARLLPPLIAALRQAGVVIHGDAHVATVAEDVLPATDNDWRDEYLCLDLAVRVVESLDGAVEHITRFGTGHTEVIVTQDRSSAHVFATRIGAATIAVNTPTQPDELLMTQRTHIRGAVHPEMFTTTKRIAWPA